MATGLLYSAALIRCSSALVISSNCNPTRELMITSLKYPKAARKQMCPFELEIAKVIRRNRHANRQRFEYIGLNLFLMILKTFDLKASCLNARI